MIGVAIVVAVIAATPRMVPFSELGIGSVDTETIRSEANTIRRIEPFISGRMVVTMTEYRCSKS